MSGDLGEGIAAALESVTREWAKAKRKAERDEEKPATVARRRASGRSSAGPAWKPRHVSVREAAFRVMEEAFKHASGDGQYYANARQIMYSARPLVQALTTSGKAWKNSSTFTQDILKDYMEEREPAWAGQVVWDDRGHFAEPHGGERIGLGGIEVGRYARGWLGSGAGLGEVPGYAMEHKVVTSGPGLRFSSVLFIEKEGFGPILEAARIADRFDLAVMSTKGMTVKAACDLLYDLGEQVRVFVVHDFDVSGLNILHTLRTGVRMSRGREVVDLGFRLEDVEGLPTETVEGRDRAPVERLAGYGATEEEIDFLVGETGYERGWSGERVELNAMTTVEFIVWLEGKLTAAGVEKVVPDGETLRAAWRRALRGRSLERYVERWRAQQASEMWAPDGGGLAVQVRERLAADPRLSWDEAVWEIATEEDEDEEGDEA